MIETMEQAAAVAGILTGLTAMIVVAASEWVARTQRRAVPVRVRR